MGSPDQGDGAEIFLWSGQLLLTFNRGILEEGCTTDWTTQEREDMGVVRTL